MAIKGLARLCPPALLYLVISIIALGIMAFMNYGNERVYCIGYYSCGGSSVYLIFILKLVYIIFWTWVLNLICDAGASILSWLLVLLPIILFFVLIGLLMVY